MNKIYKSILAVSAASIVAGVAITPASVMAWGDSSNGRTAYTTDQINAGELGNTITFDSISDGRIGDERNFVGARLSTATTNTWKANTLNVKDGDIVTVRLYVHNNSPLGYNGVATGVKTSFSLPMSVAKSQNIIGYIESSNAAPSVYWDEVELVSDEDFYMDYIEGSAKWTTGAMGTVALSDSVVTSGATVGYESLNGEIPGCYDFAGQVTIDVKIRSSVTTKLSKTVRLKGETAWGEKVDAKVGDEVEFQIEYVNLSADTAKDVMIRDVLPTNMEYVMGSTYLYNAGNQNGAKVDQNTVTTSGINIGNYSANGNAYVQFTAKVVNKTLACGNNQLVNWASSTVNSKVFKDDASVYVNVTDSCKKDAEPVDNNVKTIVNTGAGEIAGAALGAGSIVTAAGYLIASKRKF